MSTKSIIFFTVFLIAFTHQARGKTQGFFTREELIAVSPRASAEIVDTLVANQDLLAQHEIETRLRLAHFLSQIFLETGGLRWLEENLNYSAQRLLEVYGVTPAKAQEIAWKPQEIANWVYGHRLGNRGRHTDDGWNYRGSGYIQLTGRANFAARGAETRIALEEYPKLAREPLNGLRAATAYWTARDINEAADVNDRRLVRIRVNGGRALGYEEGVLWFNKIWRKIYQNREPFPSETAATEADLLAGGDDAVVRALLKKRGLLTDEMIESSSPEEAVSDALSEYQESRGLPVTGELDDETLYSITDPAEWRDRDGDAAADAPVVNPDGSSSFSFQTEDIGEESGGDGIDSFPANPESTGGEQEKLSQAEGRALSGAATYPEYEIEGGVEFDAKGDLIPFARFGDDDRWPAQDTRNFPASAIAEIAFRKSPAAPKTSKCTGAMIAPEVVLTAGHCVHSGTRRGHWYTNFEVFPGRNTDSRYFEVCGAAGVYALNGWTGASDQLEARYYDLGAIRLNCTVGERAGWFGLKVSDAIQEGTKTVVQGYARDRKPAGRQWVSEDEVRAVHPLKLFYQNDTWGGTSGAPVVGDDQAGSDAQTFREKIANNPHGKGDGVIFCVHTNGGHGSQPPWSENNACTSITRERLQTISGWIGE